MDNQKEIISSSREFIFIHGYTGGPTDFASLPELLRERFNAEIYCPLLPGHGTKVEDLLGLTHEELYAPIESHIVESLSKNKQVVLVGLSLGAQAALYFSSKYPVAGGGGAIATTHGLLFPFNLPGLGLLQWYKRVWRKQFSKDDLEARHDAIFYDAMPIDGLFLSKKLRNLVASRARRIYQPVLFIHSTHETLGNPRALPSLARRIPGKTEIRLFTERVHSMFFSRAREHLIKDIVSFLEEDWFSSPQESRERASAIVPAYNEASRIGPVLMALAATSSIEEILVVDDGSTDNIRGAVQNIPKVTLMHNEQNRGKGASMERGVAAAKNDVILFCDADLIGFTSEHAEAILQPVFDRRYSMFIGMRGNFMQRAVRVWGLNSGERALRKEVWKKLPARYKHRYRIETALNHFVKHSTKNSYGWCLFDYSQPVKESKYGLVRGTLLRWSMNADILWVYFELVARFKLLPSIHRSKN